MKAVRFHEYGDPSVLRYEDVEQPVPGPGEVRVRAVLSAVSHGTEMLVYRGEVPEGTALDLPTLAGDFSFEQTGSGEVAVAATNVSLSLGAVSVTGGTGAYANARGQITVEELSETKTVNRTTGQPVVGGGELLAFAGGLGFAVLLDPVANKVLSSPGELAWGGAASTFFWVDPAEQLTAIFLTQLAPSTTYPLRSELRQLVYQALID